MTLQEFCETLRSILDAIDDNLDDWGLDNDERKDLRDMRKAILDRLNRFCPGYTKDVKPVKRVGKDW